MKPLHVVWVNETADAIGGCERTIRETAAELGARHGVRSTLLYRDVLPAIAPGVPEAFSGGLFPLVAPEKQLATLKPDLVYVHRLNDEPLALRLGTLCQELRLPALRFFHDHRLFCPREHKYTVLGRETCTRPVGPHCYSCGGVVQKQGSRLRFTTPGRLQSLHRQLHRSYTGFVVGSHYMAEHLTQHGFPRTQIFPIPLFATPPTQLPPPFAARDPHQLVFAGQLGAMGKGLDTLLEALPHTPRDIRLTVYGTGKFEERYQQLAAQLGISQRVHWAGKASDTTLDAAFRSAAAVVVPSRSPETFGLIGPEAMRHGTPVIATRVGGMGEWLADGVTGLSVPPNNPAALAQAIQRLHASPELRQHLGESAYQRYQTQFTPTRHTDTLHALLRKLT